MATLNVLSFAPWRTTVTLVDPPQEVETMGFLIDEQTIFDWLRWLGHETAAGVAKNSVSVIGAALERDFARSIRQSLTARVPKEDVPLFVCPCGDLDCGGLFVNVRPTSDTIVWTGLGPRGGHPLGLPDFVFDAADYRARIKSAAAFCA